MGAHPDAPTNTAAASQKLFMARTFLWPTG
jgi:hypothetical protein